MTSIYTYVYTYVCMHLVLLSLTSLVYIRRALWGHKARGFSEMHRARFSSQGVER